MNTEEITHIFSYHAPFGDQEVRYDIIRDQAKSLAIHIEKWCPRSREKSLAITKLQECVMMANAAIAIHEVKPEVAPAPNDPEDYPATPAESHTKPEEQAEIRDENVKSEQEQRDLQTEGEL